MKRPKKCRPGAHVDVRVRGGKRVRCTNCGDVFPCAHDCDHRDCDWVRTGELALLEYVGLEAPA